MNNQAKIIQESKKEAIQNLENYFNSKKWVEKIRKEKWETYTDTGIQLNQAVGYQQGFREAITIAVNLMFDNSYQNIEAKPFKLIEKILEDN